MATTVHAATVAGRRVSMAWSAKTQGPAGDQMALDVKHIVDGGVD